LSADKGCSPKAAITSVAGADEETIGLCMNPDFMALIEKSRASYRAEGGIPLEEVRRRLNIPSDEPVPPISCEDYRQALDQLDASISQTQRRLLSAHYAAPARTLTASELAQAVDLGSYHATNSNYGRLGRLVGEWITFPYESDYWVESLATWRRDSDGELRLTMRPELADALEQLGWV
jgi:hypothetical protein